MGKTMKGGNTKKEAGNAKKAAVKAEADAREAVVKEQAEDSKWQKGAKKNEKKEDTEAKKAEVLRKKAERDAQLAAEEEGARAKPKGENKKTATKKSKGTLDLSQLDGSSQPLKSPTLNASGIENALDALALTGESNNTKIDRHPERRFKAAYAAFEEKRLPEIEAEHPGLRRNQRIEVCRKEFEKSEDNPFNQVAGRFDMSKEELAALREGERAKIEGRLGS